MCFSFNAGYWDDSDDEEEPPVEKKDNQIDSKSRVKIRGKKGRAKKDI
jgi:hypothetical protein